MNVRLLRSPIMLLPNGRTAGELQCAWHENCRFLIPNGINGRAGELQRTRHERSCRVLALGLNKVKYEMPLK